MTFEIRLVEGTATDPEDVSLPVGTVAFYTVFLRRTALMLPGDFRQQPDGTFFHKTTTSIAVSINNDGITEPERNILYSGRPGVGRRARDSRSQHNRDIAGRHWRHDAALARATRRRDGGRHDADGDL